MPTGCRFQIIGNRKPQAAAALPSRNTRRWAALIRISTPNRTVDLPSRHRAQRYPLPPAGKTPLPCRLKTRRAGCRPAVKLTSPVRPYEMLILENVSVKRGSFTVAENFDLQFQRGRIYTVLGPNGTGKSSLLKTLFGEVAHRGSIRYHDEVLSPLTLQSWRKRIGYMPQDTAAEAALTALEVVLLGRMDGLGLHVGDELLHEAAAVLEMLGIGHLAHRDVMRLSGGQRQLVMFAQVMMRRPEILLLDEPVSALDMRHQINLLERVAAYTRGQNLTTLMVLHDLSLAAQFSDGIVLIGGGKIHAQGTPQEVLRPELISTLYQVDVELLYDRFGAPVIRPLRHRPSENPHSFSAQSFLNRP